MDMSNGLSVADAIALQDKNGDGMFGGSNGLWIFFLFFLLAWGGNGFGFGGANAATNQVNNDFLYTNLKSTIDNGFMQTANQNFAIQKDLGQGFYGVDKSLCTGFSAMQAAINDVKFAQQQCCCETNRNIDAVRYENAKNTCDIISAANANTQAILDKMTENTISQLRTDLQSAQMQLSNLSQTQNIVNELRPCAKPAYITCSPYTSMNGNVCGNYCC